MPSSLPLEDIIAQANDIINPYKLEVKDVAWWSVYEVGHRVTDKFDDVNVGDEDKQQPHVFICGDACHTHSAKAGQGMNVSMQDAFNLGWKLGSVLTGRSPESLLATYSKERQVIAQDLIDFDKEWSTLMAKKPEEFENPDHLAEFYVNTAEFPAGFMTQYKPSMITGTMDHQDLAKGYPVGKRFRSEPVVRIGDAVPAHLGHHAKADGRWRIYAIYQQHHHDVEIPDIPKVFLPKVGPFEVIDYEKIYSAKTGEDIFDIREISRDGAVVVVRPDQYVAQVLPLSATDELAEFFGQNMLAV